MIVLKMYAAQVIEDKKNGAISNERLAVSSTTFLTASTFIGINSSTT